MDTLGTADARRESFGSTPSGSAALAADQKMLKQDR
jgi:hypothetical protein